MQSFSQVVAIAQSTPTESVRRVRAARDLPTGRVNSAGALPAIINRQSRRYVSGVAWSIARAIRP